MEKTPELVAFDIDQTLTESKSSLDPEMAELLAKLLAIKKVAIISGGAYPQFEQQILAKLHVNSVELSHLYLLPTNGTSLYEYTDGWHEIYKHDLSSAEKEKIFKAFEEAFHETGFIQPKKIYGVQIEDRDSQVTFSGLGSEAPLNLKEQWDSDHQKRKKLVEVLERKLPEFSFSIGGTTSIDVTRKGIDKAYGLQELMKYLNLPKEKVLYVGDALFPGGNDASVIPLGIKYVSEERPGLEDTKMTIRSLLL